MSSGGSQEGVRNLIDSSLVQSCKLVMQHRRVFGPQNLALAINIMLTFVHNEPTSLGILQEGKVPDTFYDAVQEGDIEPSLDVSYSSMNQACCTLLSLCISGPVSYTDRHWSIVSE
jgi:E3 ubiquitin-protein ligase HUWE1